MYMKIKLFLLGDDLIQNYFKTYSRVINLDMLVFLRYVGKTNKKAT